MLGQQAGRHGQQHDTHHQGEDVLAPDDQRQSDQAGRDDRCNHAWRSGDALKGYSMDWKTIRVVLAGALSLAVLATPIGVASREAILTVNGQNLHIESLGTTGPTVVFEAGLGNDSATWRSIAGPIAKFARVVLYDRAGLGQSVPMPKNRAAVTADEVATNLHALLAAADIPRPCILVGHSLGGLYVQMFARMYPTEVSGVILLDSASSQAPSELKT